MAILLASDTLLVNRGGTTYKMTGADLQESVTDQVLNGFDYTGELIPAFEDDDLFLVNRLDTTFKITFKEIKDSITVATAPVIGNISLVEYNPGKDARFTDQKFDVNVSMDEEGNPISEKTIDAYVQGAIMAEGKFEEPLDSSLKLPGGWTVTSATEANYWADVAYGDGKFVAIAETGTNRVMYSYDGITWTAASASKANTWSSVTYGNGKFVAVAQNGSNSYVMYSTDGINWSSANAAENNKWYSVTYGDGRFVAVANNGSNRAMWSDDGINWTPAAAGTTAWFDVTYGDGKFVAVASSGVSQIMYSVNGQNWNLLSSPANSGWRSVTYGNGKFVAVATNGTYRVMHSTDGITWRTASATADNTWYSVTFGDGKFVATAASGTNCTMNSVDGINWEPGYAPEVNGWYSVTYGDNKFVSVAANGTNRVMYSYSGGNSPTTSLEFAPGTDMAGLDVGDTVTQPTGGGIVQPDYSNTGTWTTGGAWTRLNAEYFAFNGEYQNFPFNDGTFTSGQQGQCKWEAANAVPVTSSVHIYVNDFMNAFYTTTFNVNNTGVQSIPVLKDGPNSTKVYDLTPYLGGTGFRSLEILCVNNGSNGTGPRYFSVIEIDGEPLVANAVSPTPSGTVGKIQDETVALSASTGAWVNGEDVVGPTKQLLVDGTKKYLKFNNAGQVTELLDAPQSPAYTTTDEDPTLTLTFPSQFSSGLAPDDELGDGVTLTASVVARNDAGAVGPITDTVQPVVEPLVDYSYLNGLTTLYSGNSANRNVVTGMDLANNSGLVWIKNRTGTNMHYLFDTLRGAGKALHSSESNIEENAPYSLTAFTESGYSTGLDANVNNSGQDYVAWTFQKAEGYFDVVEINGNGSVQQIPHSLGTKPGLIIPKPTNVANDWRCYHSGFGATKYIQLNKTDASKTSSTYWNDTEPTDTHFTIGNNGTFGESGQNSIVYLFAEDTPGVIKCGTYNNVSNSNVINVGFKPQWVLAKANYGTNWMILDNKRLNGLGELRPNSNATEKDRVSQNDFEFTDTGFIDRGCFTGTIGNDVVYVAIAEPPVVRSMTTEELNEQKVLFGTYENRSQINCAEEAIAARESLKANLIAQGYTAAEIDELYPSS